MAKFVAACALIVILLAAGFMFFGIEQASSTKPAAPLGHMAKLIPMEAGKWKGEDVPLGQTEEVVRAAESLLLVTEFLSRNYKTSDGRDFTLYISYWAAGKEPVIRASRHVPDNCWVGNGWKLDKDKKRDGIVYKVGDKNLKPGYYREFDFTQSDGLSVHRNVFYWYIVDGKPYHYGSGDTAIPGPAQYIRNLMNQCFEGIPEQYFIRLDTGGSIEELLKDPDVQPILKGLGELTLFEAKGENKEK